MPTQYNNNNGHVKKNRDESTYLAQSDTRKPNWKTIKVTTTKLNQNNEQSLNTDNQLNFLVALV